MDETTPIEPNDNVNETDKPDVAMNTYDMTTPIKNKKHLRGHQRNLKL